MQEPDERQQQEIAAGERWLEGFSTPEPSPASVRRTKQAVSQEAARLRSRSVVQRPWAVWRGLLAAAASITLVVTVGWYSTRSHKAPAPKASSGETAPGWTSETQEEAARFARLDEDLSDLEDWVAEQEWVANGASLYEALQGALEDGANSDRGEKGAAATPEQNFRRAEV
jgi:hypothetical protein